MQGIRFVKGDWCRRAWRRIKLDCVHAYVRVSRVSIWAAYAGSVFIATRASQNGLSLNMDRINRRPSHRHLLMRALSKLEWRSWLLLVEPFFKIVAPISRSIIIFIQRNYFRFQRWKLIDLLIVLIHLKNKLDGEVRAVKGSVMVESAIKFCSSFQIEGNSSYHCH